MEQVLFIADIVLKLGGALVILLLVVVLLYVLRLVFLAKGIIGGVKKTVETAQQSILSPMSMLGGFFAGGNTLDEDESDADF